MDQYSWDCRLPAGVQSQAGAIDEADARSPWKCWVSCEKKGVRSPSGSPLKRLGVEPKLLSLISFPLHLPHPPFCKTSWFFWSWVAYLAILSAFHHGTHLLIPSPLSFLTDATFPISSISRTQVNLQVVLQVVLQVILQVILTPTVFLRSLYTYVVSGDMNQVN